MGSSEVSGGRRPSGEKVKALVVRRIFKVLDSCNSFYSNHQRGVIRGMVWALTGEDPGDPESAATILKILGIPIRESGQEFMIDPDWQTKHGFKVTAEDLKEWEEMEPSGKPT